MIQQLPHDLVAGILATASPAAYVAAASAELAHIVRTDPLPWAHTILASCDNAIMHFTPGRSGYTPATVDCRTFPDTRGLPTPATWLMKRLVLGLVVRDAEFQLYNNVPAQDLTLVPSPLSVPAIIDDTLHPRRYRAIADVPLDALIRAWDVPYVRFPATHSWVMDAPEPLATRLNAPRLRAVPEALQLPGLFLLRGELDLFMGTTRRLAAVLPSLTTATAPVTLWIRLGIDDRKSTRSSLSVERAFPGTLGTAPITLPMYWAMMAAAEGRVTVLDFLVAELGMDAHALAAYLSLQRPSLFFLKSLIQHSAADRVMPTWRWLLANGYQYPADQLGFLSVFVSHAAEYQTLRTLFVEHEKPRILAETDLAARLERFYGVTDCAWGWVTSGHFDLLAEFAELGLLIPRDTFEILKEVNARDQLDRLLPLTVSLSPRIEGGMAAVIDFGSLDNFWELRFAIQLAYQVWPDTFAQRMAEHGSRPSFIQALASLTDVHDKLDQKRLAVSVVVHLFGEDPLGSPDLPRVQGIGSLMLSALCDSGDLGASTWAAVHALSPAQRISLFGVLCYELPTAEDLEPPLSDRPKPGAWPAWQSVLDRVLPSALDSPADLSENVLVMGRIERGTISWMVPRHNPDGNSFAQHPGDIDPWATDPPTVTVVVALPIDRHRRTDSMPLWIAARLCLLAPDVVLPAVKFTAKTPAWLWQLRLDRITTPVHGLNAWQPEPLKNWATIVSAALASGRKQTALLAMRIARHEQAIDGDDKSAKVLLGLAKKRGPEVLELAREAGFSNI
ncbi:hypothetical protein BC828DRAFT_441537 [Blastocladiella britannica]|nr:hypothetical protein BC828DRAFT_441537 [Blastocladiella britannica]